MGAMGFDTVGHEPGGKNATARGPDCREIGAAWYEAGGLRTGLLAVCQT